MTPAGTSNKPDVQNKWEEKTHDRAIRLCHPSYSMPYTRIDPLKGGSIILVCVCVIIPFILDVRLVDVPAGVTQEEGNTGFLTHLPSAVLALIFLTTSF